MKEAVLLGVVALIAAVGGGTWYAVLVAPSPASHAMAPVGAPSRPASAAAKPTAKPTAKVKSADSVAAQRDSASRTPADTAKPATPPVGPAAPADSSNVRAKAVGKILAGMKPKEAADILGRLPDDDVERIVRQLTAKQVAALLTALPDDRAAALSRRLLQSPSMKGNQ